MMIIIIVISFLSFIDLSSSSSDQILRANIGQDVTISCIFENESQIDQVLFMHQTTGDLLSVGLELFVDEYIPNNHMKLNRFSSNRLDLKIISVNGNDSGVYTCMYNDEKLSSFSLEIFIPPRFISFFPKEASVSHPEGSSLNLSCHAYAHPPTNITWIYRNKNKQFKTIHNGENIYISLLESTDSGSYECIASNGYHATISRSFYVTVQYPPRVIINKLVDIHNLPIQLNCQICSLPLSNIQWIKNGKNISTEEDFIIKTSSTYPSNEECLITKLTIDESSYEKSGRYECRGENILGHYSDHVDFYPKLIPKIRSRNEHFALLLLPNNTYQISNSSKSLIELINEYLILILIIVSLV